MRLLVVEDEVKTGNYLKQGLTEAGFMVILARNGLDGHHQAMTENFDLLVLDVMLPDIDGWRIFSPCVKPDARRPYCFLPRVTVLMTVSRVWSWELTIIWSSLLHLPNCLPGFALCYVAVACQFFLIKLGSPISFLIFHDVELHAVAKESTSATRNFVCWNFWSAIKVRCCRVH